VEAKHHTFLNSALDGCEWSAWSFGYCYPRERASRTHLTGGWDGFKAGLDVVV